MKFPAPLKLSDLAELTRSRVIGEGTMLVTGINEIHKVAEGDITFVDHPKYYDKALNSAATFVIINKDVPAPPGKALLFSHEPFDAYIAIIKKYRPFEPAVKSISDSAMIGEGTVIQ